MTSCGAPRKPPSVPEKVPEMMPAASKRVTSKVQFRRGHAGIRPASSVRCVSDGDVAGQLVTGCLAAPVDALLSGNPERPGDRTIIGRFVGFRDGMAEAPRVVETLLLKVVAPLAAPVRLQGVQACEDAFLSFAGCVVVPIVVFRASVRASLVILSACVCRGAAWVASASAASGGEGQSEEQGAGDHDS